MSISPILSHALTVAAKELRNAFRDRQTLIYAVVLPLVMYPALFWILLQAQSVIEGRRDAREVDVVLAAAPDVAAVARELALDLALLDEESVDEESVAAESVTAGATESAPAEDADSAPVDTLPPVSKRLNWLGAETSFDVDEGLRRMALDVRDVDVIDAVLEVGRNEAGATQLTVYFDSSRPASVLARSRVAEQLEDLGQLRRKTRAAAAQVDLAALAPFEVERLDLAPKEAVGALVISMILPLMLIVMSVMGSFYPAVDLTAGEVERGTQETTLLIPISRVSIQLGKLLAVAASGGLAAAMNVLGIVIAANHLLSMMDSGGQLQFEISTAHIALALPLLFAFLLFVSAVLVSIASFARTFKQGQSMLGSAQMLFILPAMASSLPGLAFSPALAAIPVVGVAMALRALLRGAVFSELPWLSLTVAFVVQLVYAGLALFIGVKLLSREWSDASDERSPRERAVAAFRSLFNRSASAPH